NGDWGKKAFSQGLIGAGISLVGFGAGYAAMAGAEAIGMSAGLAGLTSGAIGGAVAGGVSAGIYGGNIGQGMLAGGFGGLMGSAVNMGSVGESFIKRGIASTLTGSVAGGFTAGFLGGDVRQGMRNGAVSGAVGFMTTWAGEYLQKTIISQKYAEEIMEIDREYRKQLENYGSEKINVTNNLPDPDKVLWNRLEAVYEKYGVPIDWLRSRDYDSKAILKFGKMHIRYGSDKMVNPTAYGRKADRSAYGLKSNQINVHYDKFDVIKYPVLHLYFDTYKQGRLGVH
ncbi:MAG: hypothetical protein LBH32_03060, partial [Dysgonamonadaceae bacterium]|nr:hypothetical protein [Dysgonamonadaceae bacterium]